MGNKSDLRDPRGSGSQVNQERALSFAKAHKMKFFETSAMRPPGRRPRGGQRDGGEEALQQDTVEDIVFSVGAKLKRQTGPSGGSSPGYSGSFRVTSKAMPEKELWMCC